jgi:hypothetical protein
MSDAGNHTDSCSFVVTILGHQAHRLLETCSCRLFFNGGLLECRDCGTIYGTLNDMARESNIRPFARGKSARS